jgi:prepilin-type N-terminal cleavage/methylation domain-containing protein
MGSNRKKRRRAFTLIEVLAAMTVLAILVVLVARIFGEGLKAWEIGSRESEAATNARAAVDHIAREMSMAVATTNITLILGSDKVDTYKEFKADQVQFVALSEEPDTLSRSARELFFYVRANTSKGTTRYELMRGVSSKVPLSAYRNPGWTPPKMGSQVLIPNLVTFEVWVYKKEGANLVEVFDYDSSIDGPPLLADIYVETMSETDAIKASALHAADPTAALEYVTKVAKGYMARVYFNHRTGHSDDR